MKMAVGNLPQVVLEYFDAVVLPAAARAGGAAPFLAGMAGGLVAQRAPAMVEQYLPVLRTLGVVDDNSNIDVDLIYESASKSLEKNPFTVAGYQPNKDDLDKLKALMEKHGA